ncbi:MAG: DUF1549 domain-containing protein [Pirellulaceae bacterium]
MRRVSSLGYLSLRMQKFTLLLLFVLAVTSVSPAVAQKKKKLPSQSFKGYGGLPDAVRKFPESLPPVATVDAGRIGDCRESARKIDELVEANLKKHGLAPNPEADDHTWVRRVFLDAVGTIPTLIETNAYTTSKEPSKQEKLVDTLLNSHGYPSHMFNFWASILRVKDRPEGNMLAYSYRDYIRDQLRINRPYDEWVYEMLTAEGKVWENPAVGYALRDNGMQLVHVDNTVRVFLGTQIGCAQCHDHPFDDWTQKEFYQLAAFTHGTATRDGGGTPAFANGNPVKRLTDELKKADPDARLVGTPNLLVQANLFRVSFNATRKLKLPHDYQYDNGKPNEVVEPKVLWGDIPSDAKQLSPRAICQMAYQQRESPVRQNNRKPSMEESNGRWPNRTR